MLAYWLIAAATGPEAFAYANDLFGSILGRLVLLGYTWALLHHMFGGIRHLVWDTGRGFSLGTIDLMCWLSLIASLACTVLIWILAGGFEGSDLTMNMRTPLKNVRSLGSAKEGADHFWQQRLTAVANIVLAVIAVWLIAGLVGAPHADVKAAIANPAVAIVLLLLVLSGIYHMRLGMQVIIEDYIRGEGSKVVLLMLNTFFSIAIGLASVFAVLKINFGT